MHTGVVLSHACIPPPWVGEWRGGLTPWAFMTQHRGGGTPWAFMTQHDRGHSPGVSHAHHEKSPTGRRVGHPMGQGIRSRAGISSLGGTSLCKHWPPHGMAWLWLVTP